MSPAEQVTASGATGRLRYVIQRERDRRIVALAGEVNENSDLAVLRPHIQGDTVLDLAGIEHINSCGVREWITCMKELPAGSRITYRNCSPTVVLQLNTVVNFAMGAAIESVLAPFSCMACGAQLNRAFEVSALRQVESPAFEPVPCKCGDVMEFDEVPERYFLFLRFVK